MVWPVVLTRAYAKMRGVGAILSENDDDVRLSHAVQNCVELFFGQILRVCPQRVGSGHPIIVPVDGSVVNTTADLLRKVAAAQRPIAVLPTAQPPPPRRLGDSRISKSHAKSTGCWRQMAALHVP